MAKKVVKNFLWLFMDKIVRMGVGLFVGVWIARYLSPEKYGLLNYTVAFAGLFGAVSSLGLDTIVVRDLIKEPAQENTLLGTAFRMRIAGACLAIVVSTISIMFVRTDRMAVGLTILASFVYLFQTFDVIDYYFQSKLLSKYTVWAKNTAFFIFAAIRLSMLYFDMDIAAFAIAMTLEIGVGSIFMIVVYQKNNGRISMWIFDMALAKRLLRESFPLILSGIAIAIYMRIDQIMLGCMLDDSAVGNYSVAVRISEIWYFIPMAISSSLYPTLIEAKKAGQEKYLRTIKTVFKWSFWLSVIVAGGVSFYSGWIVNLLYGDAYHDAAGVLAIHIWCGVFVFLGVLSNNYLVIENLTRLSLYRTVMGAVINVALNFLLIPMFGIAGSALATLCAQAAASYFVDIFNSQTRALFWLKTRSMVPFL